MDEMEIYVNVERASDHAGGRISLGKCSDDIYANSHQSCTVGAARPGPAHSGFNDRNKKSSCRGAAVSLGLLCLVFLTGLITLVYLYTKGSSDWKKEMLQLNISYNNVTEEKQQLQNSCSNLYKDRDEWQKKFEAMTKERDDLQKELQDTKEDWKKEMLQLNTSYNNVTEEKQQLQNSYSNLSKDRDEWQKKFEAMTKERDDLQKELQETEATNRKLFSEKCGLKSLQGLQWMYFRNSFYHVSSKEKTWEQSREECQRNGADLLVINSKEEQIFANQFEKQVWIGLTDSETEETWKWVDGTTLTARYWASGEPNGGKGENCGQIKTYDSENSWNDEGCSVPHSWVCEKKVLP